MCSTLGLHKKSLHLFFGVVRLGDVGGGGWSMFQEVGDCMGFRGGRGDLSSELSQPGGKSC